VGCYREEDVDQGSDCLRSYSIIPVFDERIGGTLFVIVIRNNLMV
jgi:hypothetical protein